MVQKAWIYDDLAVVSEPAVKQEGHRGSESVEEKRNSHPDGQEGCVVGRQERPQDYTFGDLLPPQQLGT